MEDMEFLSLADQAMEGFLDLFEDFDPDELDVDLAQGVLRMEFANGGVCVMNRQTAAHQLWLAEGATAWHFDWKPEDGTWVDTKGRGPLTTVLEEVLTKRLGRAVSLPRG